MIVWRADNRSPEEIKRAKGFHPRSRRSPREVIQSFRMNYSEDPKLHAMEHVRASNDNYVSTGVDDTCGGYIHARYIYEIDIPDLNPAIFSNLTLGFNGPLKRFRQTSFDPKLMLTGTTIDNSEMVAILQPKLELTFVTPIPLKYIKKFRETNSRTWTYFS
ncbi:hypothetical protein ACX3SV_04245 [Hafnia paralvei]